MAHTITNYPSGDTFDPSNPSSTEVQQVSPTDDCNVGVVALFNSVKNLSDNKADASSLAAVATTGSYADLSNKPLSYLYFTITGTIAVNDDLTPHIPLFTGGTFVAEQFILKTASVGGGINFNIYLNGSPLAYAGLIAGQKQTTGGAGYFNPSTFQADDYLSVGCSTNNGAADATIVIVVQYS